MARDLFWGRLSKISVEEKIDLIFEVLIPATYLRAIRRGSKEELKKINFYKREILKLLESPNIEDYQKQEFMYRLKSFDYDMEYSI